MNIATPDTATEAIGDRLNRTRSRATFLILTSSTLALYLLTLSHDYIGDGLQFAINIESGDLKSILLPEHMGYPLIGFAFFHLWQLAGWQGGALVPLQVLSAVSGALSVGLMYLCARKITRSEFLSLWVAVCFAVTAGVWVYSTDAHVAMLPLCVSLLLMYALLTDHDRSRFVSPLILGLLCFLSVAIFETGVLLVVPVVVSYIMSPQMGWPMRIRQSGLFILIAGLPSLILYVLVAVTVFGVRTLPEWFEWHFRMSSTGLWAKASLSTPIKAANSLVRDMGGYPGFEQHYWSAWLPEAPFTQKTIWALSTLAIVAGLLFSVYLIIRRRIYQGPAD